MESMIFRLERPSHSRRPAALQVVICYEDFDSGVRAMDLYQRVIETNAGEFGLKIWKMEPLGIPAALGSAVNDANRADLIIVSVRGNRPLPYEALAWMEGWRKNLTRQEQAIVFIVDPEERQSASALLAARYIESLAASAGLKYFAALESNPIRMDAILETGTRIAGSPVRHSTRYNPWGLNE